MIEQERTFYVNGVPITWHEIYDWWNKLRSTDPNKAKSIGDPYYQENTCWYIANKIVEEIELKIHGRISNNFKPGPEDVKQKDTYVVKRIDDVDVDWRDQSAVFKKALEDAEKKYKERIQAEKNKKAQEEYEKYRHQQARQKQKSESSPPPPKPVELDWREILGISYGITVTENMIKTKFWKMAKICHPDMGGSNEKMDKLFRARDLAYKAIGLNPP